MSSFLVFFVGALANILYVALIGRVLISWLNIGPASPFFPIVNVLYQITEPILAPIRRILPRFGMLDLSPMVAILFVTFIQRLLRGLLA